MTKSSQKRRYNSLQTRQLIQFPWSLPREKNLEAKTINIDYHHHHHHSGLRLKLPQNTVRTEQLPSRSFLPFLKMISLRWCMQQGKFSYFHVLITNERDRESILMQICRFVHFLSHAIYQPSQGTKKKFTDCRSFSVSVSWCIIWLK